MARFLKKTLTISHLQKTEENLWIKVKLRIIIRDSLMESLTPNLTRHNIQRKDRKYKKSQSNKLL